MYSLDARKAKQHVATYYIIIITTIVWLLQVYFYGANAGSGENLLAAGGLFGPWITAHPEQIWRLFSAMFLHISWMHWLMNMVTLFLVGRIIEEELGSFRFALIYILSGIFANAMTFFISFSSLSVGASTAIFGMFGAIATLGFYTNSPRLREVSKGFIVLIILVLISNIFQSRVNIIGHFGGVIGGALLSAIFPPAKYKKWLPQNIRILATLTFILLFLLFVSLPFFR